MAQTRPEFFSLRTKDQNAGSTVSSQALVLMWVASSRASKPGHKRTEVQCIVPAHGGQAQESPVHPFLLLPVFSQAGQLQHIQVSHALVWLEPRAPACSGRRPSLWLSSRPEEGPTSHLPFLMAPSLLPIMEYEEHALFCWAHWGWGQGAALSRRQHSHQVAHKA